MENKINEKYLKLIQEYIEEARKAPEAVPTSLFFKDNTEAKFFSVVSQIKTGDLVDYYFKLDKLNGHLVATDINKNTKTKGCTGDMHLDTMIHGNRFEMVFGSCGTLGINNVTGLKVFMSMDELNADTPYDSMEIENDFDKTSSEFVDEYFKLLQNAEIGDEVHVDSKYKYDGAVLEKFNDFIRVELGRNGGGRATIVNLSLINNPFTEENGDITLNGKGIKGDKAEFDFSIPVKKFFIDFKNEKPKQKQQQQGNNDPEGVSLDPMRDAKAVLDAIVNDEGMKKAFYSQPSWLNLIINTLKGKNREGRGIVPAKEIIQKYRITNYQKQLGEIFRNFSFNKPIVYTLLSKSIEFPVEKGEPVKYTTNKQYRAIVKTVDLKDKYLTLSDEKAGVEIQIKSQNKRERKENTFNVTFIKEVIENGKKVMKNVDAVITIDSRRNSGYYDYKRQIKTR
jgi:hypothetical protein